MFGYVAEHRSFYRPVFFGSFIVLAKAFGTFPLGASLTLWLPAAVLIGLATGAADTVATLFVVNFTPKSEWEIRIGWLQNFNGTGQLAGLLMASALVGKPAVTGFFIGAELALLAVVVGRIGLPPESDKRLRKHPFRHVPI